MEPLKPLKQVRKLANDQVEKYYLQRLIQAINGDMDDAIALSGVSRSHLYALLKKHDIPFE